MSKVFVAAALMLALGAASVQAEQRGMSKSKLSNLGLSSFEPVSDEAGMEVRGMGRSFAAGAFMATAGTGASGVLSYAFATRRPGAITAGQGLAVSEYIQIFNGSSFSFAAQAFGNSAAFGP